jgi:hypothetical protein
VSLREPERNYCEAMIVSFGGAVLVPMTVATLDANVCWSTGPKFYNPGVEVNSSLVSIVGSTGRESVTRLLNYFISRKIYRFIWDRPQRYMVPQAVPERLLPCTRILQCSLFLSADAHLWELR